MKRSINVWELVKTVIIRGYGLGQYKRQDSSISLLKSRITAIFNQSKQIYDSLCIPKLLKHQGLIYSKSYIALIMKELSLRSVLSNKFRICTTDSNHTFALADNLLNKDFTSTQLGEKSFLIIHIKKLAINVITLQRF